MLIDVKAMRSGFEIRADILFQIKNGVDLPTRIMYTVNCNWAKLGSYLDKFVEQGLVEYSIPVRG
jgi:predicted transcriptional regulator